MFIRASRCVIDSTYATLSTSSVAASTRPSSSGSVVIARNSRATVTSWSGRPSTVIGSPALISPPVTTRKNGPGSAACVNRFTQPAVSSHPANVRHGIRPEVTSSTTCRPIRQRSPIRAALTSMPAVVRFSPKEPGASSRPNSAPHRSRSSRAYAYTAWSFPPWNRRSHTASPATPLPTCPRGPGAATATGPWTGRLSMPVSPDFASVYGTALADARFTESTQGDMSAP